MLPSSDLGQIFFSNRELVDNKPFPPTNYRNHSTSVLPISCLPPTKFQWSAEQNNYYCHGPQVCYGLFPISIQHHDGVKFEMRKSCHSFSDLYGGKSYGSQLNGRGAVPNSSHKNAIHRPIHAPSESRVQETLVSSDQSVMATYLFSSRYQQQLPSLHELPRINKPGWDLPPNSGFSC